MFNWFLYYTVTLDVAITHYYTECDFFQALG